MSYRYIVHCARMQREEAIIVAGVYVEASDDGYLHSTLGLPNPSLLPS
jgi:hypothetical protein